MTFFKENGKKLFAEAVGTFLLVFLSTITHQFIDPIGFNSFILYAVGVVLLAYGIIKVSGCHINPAVSLGSAVNKEITWKQAAGYIAAQILGAIVAGLLFLAIFHFDGHHVFTHAPTEALDIPFMLFLEFGVVFVFVLLVVGDAAQFEKSKVGGLVIGATLIVEHLIALCIHGASVNPAIMIANLFAGGFEAEALKNIWLYIVPVAVAALAAGLVAKYAFEHHHPHAHKQEHQEHSENEHH